LSQLIQVYPNPTHDKFIVNLNSKSFKKLSMRIMSADGRLVEAKVVSSPSGNYHEEFSLQKYSAGVYFLELQNETQKATVKLILQ